MYQIKFDKPRFDQKIFTSFRLGEKHHMALSVNQVVSLRNSYGLEVGQAKVKDKTILKYSQIPLPLFELNHDPGCRDYEAMSRELMRVYPDWRGCHQQRFTVLTLEVEG